MTRTATGRGPNTPTTRPSTARKVTRKTEEKRKSGLNEGMRITVPNEHGEAEVFEVRYGDVTPAIARELRRQTGFGWQGLMDQMAQFPDIDLLSAFVWVARRCRGEFIQFDSVEVTYGDMDSAVFDIERSTDEGTPDPEA